MVLFHNGTDSFIINETGNLKITQGANDADIVFECDDGSGGTGVYFLLDGSLADGSNKFTRFLDRSRVCFGDAADLQIYHDGTTSNIQNSTGNLSIINHADDGDIKFFSDDGSGGVTEYFRVDGGTERVESSKSFRFADGARAQFGASSDLQIHHNGTDSYIENDFGDLYIKQSADDKNIIFQSDDGSGGVETYFFLDGGDSSANPLTVFPDNARAGFGASGDLQIYHDGSNSYIKDTGTGHLNILGSNIQFLNTAGNKYYATFADGAQVKLFYNGVEKIETTITGVKISGVSEYADNTAAISGGLTAGDVYRTGDLLKIVH